MMQYMMVSYEPAHTDIMAQHSSGHQKDTHIEHDVEVESDKEKREQYSDALKRAFKTVRDERVLVAHRFRVDLMVYSVYQTVTNPGMQNPVRNVEPKVVGKNVEKKMQPSRHLKMNS
jgi:hypothetical protein